MTSPEQPQHSTETDYRLYVPHPQDWVAKVKQGSEKEYCYSKAPGEEHFHLLLTGELFLQHHDEKFCLNCAVRIGVVTTDRLHWQHTGRVGLAGGGAEPS